MSISNISHSDGKQPGLSVSGIETRTKRALEIEDIFSKILPGQELVNASVYLDRLALLKKRALEDRMALNGIKVDKPVQKARDALQAQIEILTRVENLARKNGIMPAEKFPWDGKLRPQETPLHWAVRNHDRKTALILRSEIRRSRLVELCRNYAPKIKPDVLPKLALSIEILHVLQPQEKDFDAACKKLFKDDPKICKAVYRKILEDPAAERVLNGLDVCGDLDAKGMSPLDEALLQKDAEMSYLLLFPNLIANPQLSKVFWARNNELKSRIDTMRQVDPNALSDASKAAYFGDIDALMQMSENNLKKKDAKGLTSLHFALLGKQTKAILYLIDRIPLNTLTPQGHSYLDYALLSGRADIFRLFEERHLPFRLSGNQEKFSYLLASGILEQQLNVDAQAKDPIRTGGVGATNGIWAASALFNWATGFPKESWLGWAGQGMKDLAYEFNWYNPKQFKNFLPDWTQDPLVGIYLRILGPAILPYVVGAAANIAGIKLPAGNWTNVTSAISKCYTALRLYAAVKPVLSRLPAYWDAYTSRPGVVREKLAGDLFNIGTQVLMDRKDLMSFWRG